eukprot:12912900-Prorocentrum_lima.AAC.1
MTPWARQRRDCGGVRAVAAPVRVKVLGSRPILVQVLGSSRCLHMAAGCANLGAVLGAPAG